jgi:hypothetical protein
VYVCVTETEEHSMAYILSEGRGVDAVLQQDGLSKAGVMRKQTRQRTRETEKKRQRERQRETEGDREKERKREREKDRETHAHTRAYRQRGCESPRSLLRWSQRHPAA